MSRKANPNHPIHEPIAARRSPYGFDGRPVGDDDLRSILEAARWSASAFNEQPWNYIVARKSDGQEYDRVLSCLVEPNQAWAKEAPVLVLTVVAENYTRNGKANASAMHDLGQASANLTVEATVRGISVHQMAGILPDQARELFAIPEGYRAVTGLAIGYAADPDNLTDELKERDTAPRPRKPLEDFVFSGRWGQPSAAVNS
jgi:nitroreductase